ncbi:MAG: chorismate synthase [Candidatus Deianiraeaceae bacterium]|jgi:chorismate synthase
MASNYFGRALRFISWGESHGFAIGCIIDGCPSLIPLTEEDFIYEMSRRRPGQSKFTTQRNEDDEVKILSGIFEGQTTGTPISLIIYNKDQRSHDYGDIVTKFRPNHADYTYHQKYGIRDYRGGGRSSARETAMRVATGVIARKIIPNIQIYASVVQLGKIKINADDFSIDFINKNPLFIGSPSSLSECEEYLADVRKRGSSVGAILEIVAKNVPVGLGEPIYYKLDSQIANAMMSINAVKGVEIGQGFGSGKSEGIDVADEMFYADGGVKFSNNNNGGMIGGISSGQDIVCRVAVKPTSSILQEKRTIDVAGNNTTIITKGRHDPCVGLRAVPVVEAMLACVLADMTLLSSVHKK